MLTVGAQVGAVGAVGAQNRRRGSLLDEWLLQLAEQISYPGIYLPHYYSLPILLFYYYLNTGIYLFKLASLCAVLEEACPKLLLGQTAGTVTSTSVSSGVCK